MNELETVEYKGIRVLTTQQLAEAYGGDGKIISYNFNHNKSRYVENKHFICLSREDLRAFRENHDLPSNLNKLYLWTEKGALLHAKSLNTDKAWEVYDYLVDFYFRVKEEKKLTKEVKLPVVRSKTEVDVNNPIPIFKTLLKLAEDNGFRVDSYKFEVCKSCINGKSIGINTNLSLEKVDYELAYILSHAFIHIGEGNLIDNPNRAEYDRRAENAAKMIISVLDIVYA